MSDVLILSAYGIPGDETSKLQVELTHQLRHDWAWKGAWIAAGDWNQPFVDSWMEVMAEVEGGAQLNMDSILSTRWEGSRKIDFLWPTSSVIRFATLVWKRFQTTKCCMGAAA